MYGKPHGFKSVQFYTINEKKNIEWMEDCYSKFQILEVDP